MRAITVQQPWAWAIIHGGKNIENRTRIGTWRPALGQRIAIHAGQRWSDEGNHDHRVARAARAAYPTPEPRDNETVLRHNAEVVMPAVRVFGAIIGTVKVVDVHDAEPGRCDPDVCKPWGEDSYIEHGGTKRVNVVHLVLHRPVLVDPIPCRGALGLWTLSGVAAAEMAEVVQL